jgi:aspyridone synthetase (hybrid polyketide synthase/nonribosomal peptide synthetase)
MVFKTLDIEKPVAGQGYTEHSYDIIIAANVLHATRDLTATMQHARSLLKPGGFLVLVEVTGLEVLRLNFVMGGLPGWWLGADDGRRLHPGITLTEWDELLQETKFSGVDLVYQDLADSRKHCTSLLVSQAVDDSYLGLRDPLPAMTDFTQDAPLLIIGGKSLAVSKMTRELQKLLPPSWRRQVQAITDLDALNLSSLTPGTDVICLQELDSPLFSMAVSDPRLKAIQNLFLNSANVIWVVQHGHSGSPEANMFLGIARALSQELPHVHLQYVNFESSKSPSAMARTTLEAFVRLKIASTQSSGMDNLVWTREPEILIDGEHTLIPRVLPNRALNERYNASRRTLCRPVDIVDTTVQVVASQTTLALTETTSSKGEKEHLKVTPQYSLQIPTNDHQGAYLCFGYLEGSRNTVLVLSPTNQSMLEVPAAGVIPIDAEDCNPSTLQQVAIDLFAQAISSLPVSSGGSVLVYYSEETLATFIEAQCARRKTNGILLASSQPSMQPGRIYIHPQGSLRATQRRIPNNVTVFVDCSKELSARRSIQPCLPKGCEIHKLDTKLLSLIDVQEGLAEAYSTASSNPSLSHHFPVLNVQNLPGMAVSILNAPFITDWQTTIPLQLPIQQPGGEGMFQPHKTYLMVGMAGGLGLSVCLWAIRQGARHVVITSRNPKIDAKYFEDAGFSDADIRIISMDVSNRSSVDLVVSLVRETMPPIAGVCNAAMVLSDKLFVDMDAEIIDKVLKPKMDGTQHLHDVFTHDRLDFFILFSSLGSIVGNPGQSNYHAANLFMAGLAARRRDQGLTASVIHIGLVTDVGYVTRQDRSVQDHLSSLLFLPLSETDIHHAFSEAIEAGKPDSQHSFEIIMGIEPLSKPVATERQPWWLSKNPKFAHFKPSVTVQQEKRTIKASSGSIKQGVEKSDSEEGAIALVEQAFCAKLESMMQLPAGSVQVQEPLLALGIDSLVAVEIRTWFLKELGADVPVLKILGGDSVAQICIIATKRLLADMLEKNQSTAPSAEDLTDSTSTPEDSSDATLDSGDSVATSELGDSQDMSAKDQILGNMVPETPRGDHFDITAQPQTPISIQEEIVSEIMSDPQSRIWFVSKHVDDPTTYNMTFQYEVQGHLSIPRLRHALHTMLQHHEGLRTRFYARLEDGHPMQGVLSNPMYMFNHVDNASDADISRASEYLKHHIWDLERGQTLGMTVLSRSSASHTIILGYHHIIMDGVSLHLFLRDLNVTYQMQTPQGKAGTCIEYALEQLQAKQSQIMQSQIQFWKDEFVSLPRVLPLLPMACTRTRPIVQAPRTNHVYREIGHEQMATLKKACQALRITPFHFHLSVLQVMLALYAETDDICIGVADANRTDERFAETIGFFLNLLPVRFQIVKGDEFSELAQAAARKAFAALANSSVPCDAILDQVNVSRSTAHTPLFQVAINYRMGAVWEVPLGDCRMKMGDVQDARNPYDLSWGIIETSSGTSLVELAGQESLYDAEACQTILDTYMRLLQTFTKTPDLRLQDCQLHDPSGVSSALTVGRGPRVRFDWPRTLAERMQLICGTYGPNVAVEDRSQSLTYSQLAGLVNTIAGRILELQCGPGSRIAVLCEPSVDFIAAMLAILQVGAVYVPLDTSLPSTRHESMARICQPRLLLCHAATKGLAENLTAGAEYALPTVMVDQIQSHRELVPCLAEPDSPAVLLFTSGSTGMPKGILLSQANFVNHLALKAQALGLQQEPVLQQSSMGFDMSLIQTFCALANGGTLVIVPAEARRDPVKITQIMLQKRIGLTIATPSEYSMWLRYGAESLEKHFSWRHACMGGEHVSDQLKGEFRRLELPSLALTNCYGPTEITAAATFQHISLWATDAAEPPNAVGKALPNYSIYIVDGEGQPLPVGLQGEICIGGSGVSLGYLDLPEQTAQKFIREINTTQEDQYQTMYRTGDRGRLLSDGTLVFLGRLDGDTQIKLHGVRIELGEIEASILQIAQGLLCSVVVTAREDVLVAHAVLAAGETATDIELEQLLARLHLPQYMRPARIVVLSDLPTNANGKVDRKALQKLPLPQQGVIALPEDNMTLREGELRIMWEKVLPNLNNSHRLSPSSDFFLEGGNSLRLMKLQGVIKETLGVSISTHELYQACTLRQMAACIDNCRDADAKDEINWALETAVPEPILAAAREGQMKGSQRVSRDGVNVLLTGSTSFLGINLVKSLISNPVIQQVHCVAVLPDEEHKLPRSEKISTYRGSLSSPALGLSPADCEQLHFTVDVVVHAGANGHCLNQYSSLRVPNVHSTHFLASFAVRRSIPLIYISSNRVGLLSGNTAPLPVSMASFLPQTDGTEGLTASKWTSECFLEKLAACVPLPIQVHRPCVVVGAEAPNSDALNAILKYSALMRTVPRFDRADGYLDFQPVDEAAREIAEDIVAFAKHPTTGPVHFQHHSGKVKVPVHEYRAYMERIHGHAFAEVPILEWVSKALQAGIDPLITAYLQGIVERGELVTFPYLGDTPQ